MRVLITGGTGFIGARLAVMARDAGHEVRLTGLVNTPAEAERKRALEAAGIGVLVRPLEPPVPVELVAGIDAIIHLGAAQHEINVPDGHFEKINHNATRSLFEAAREAGTLRFVQGSTIGVYGTQSGTIDETTPVAPDNVYGRTKLEAEHWLREQEGQPAVVVIRIGETYGPGDVRLLKLFQGIARGRFPQLGSGRNLHQPIYVDDLADGLLAAARGRRSVRARRPRAGHDRADDRPRGGRAGPPEARAPPAALAVPGCSRGARGDAPPARHPAAPAPPADGFLHQEPRVFDQRRAPRARLRAARRLRRGRREAEGARLTAAWYRERRLLERPSGPLPERARRSAAGSG